MKTSTASYSKIMQALADKQSSLQYVNQVDIDDVVNIENNFKNRFMHVYLLERFQFLQAWQSSINESVFVSKPDKRSFTMYVQTWKFESLDIHNRACYDDSLMIEFTQQLYDKFEIDYINYQIKRLTEYLIEQPLYRRSTVTLSNLLHEWKMECYQQILKIFKNILLNTSSDYS